MCLSLIKIFCQISFSRLYIYIEATFSSLREELIFCLQSAQRLIESLDSLEYIGPMEMFTKLSKVKSKKKKKNNQVPPGGRARPCVLGEGAQLGDRDRVKEGFFYLTISISSILYLLKGTARPSTTCSTSTRPILGDTSGFPTLGGSQLVSHR